MARFILIDNCTGYIFGDTADINGRFVACESPIEAARVVDESIGEHGRSYEDVSRLASNETGYQVYRADVDGKAIPAVFDGRDAATIEAVERGCKHVAAILCSRPE